MATKEAKGARGDGEGCCYFILEGTGYACNEDVDGRTRWHAMVQTMKLLALENEPETLGCMAFGCEDSSNDWLVCPTREWRSELVERNVEELDVRAASECGAIDLQKILKKVRLQLMMHKKETKVFLMLCGASCISEDESLDALITSVRSACREFNIVALGEDLPLAKLSLLQAVCRCPQDDGDCLFPYACAQCSSIATAISSMYSIVAELERHGMMSHKGLFTSESKWEKAYQTRCPESLQEALARCRKETEQKRLRDVQGALSNYYSNFVSTSMKDDENPEDGPTTLRELIQSQKGNKGKTPDTSTSRRGNIGCGRQASYGFVSEKPIKYMFGIDQSVAVDIEELGKVLHFFSKPICILKCGRLLRAFGSKAGRLEGKMKLSPSSHVGKLEIWINIDDTISLIWNKDIDSKSISGATTLISSGVELIWRVRERSNQNLGVKILWEDPSERSFSLTRSGKEIGYYWMRNGAKEEMSKFKEFLGSMPRIADFFSPSEMRLYEKLMKCELKVETKAKLETKLEQTFQKGFLEKQSKCSVKQKEAAHSSSVEPVTVGTKASMLKRGFFGKKEHHKKGKAKGKEIRMREEPLPAEDPGQEPPPHVTTLGKGRKEVPKPAPAPAPGSTITNENLKSLFR